MATVRFYAADQALLPGICVRTGAPTNDRVEVAAYYRPSWPLLLAPFTLLAAGVGILAGSRRYRVSLPFSGELADRYRLWRTPILGSLAAALVLVGIGAAIQDAKIAVIGAAIAAAAAGATWINLTAHTCSVSANSDGTVITIRRCSKYFKSALKSLAT